MHRHDQVWIWYSTTVAATAILFAHDARGGHPWPFVGIHATILAVLFALRRLLRDRGPTAGRMARGLFSAVAILVAFSSNGLVLPALHPEPYEFTWIEWDRTLFGRDPTVAMQSWLTPWLTEVLQWAYASFYLIPVATVIGCGRRGGTCYDRALVVVVFGFQLSYLGYFLWPTLPPREFLDHGAPLQGLWMTGFLHEAINTLELGRWDCFPSGHTMLTLISLALCWRDARALLWVLAPVSALLIVATMALRYHYAADVLAGAAFAAGGLWLARGLSDPGATSASRAGRQVTQ